MSSVKKKLNLTAGMTQCSCRGPYFDFLTHIKQLITVCNSSYMGDSIPLASTGTPTLTYLPGIYK